MGRAGQHRRSNGRFHGESVKALEISPETSASRIPGGTLSGNLTIKLGAVVANTGGTIGPVRRSGTLTVNANLTLNAGSTYFVEVNGSSADLVVVKGAARSMERP
ncbi:MAG: hypothetical protein U0794_22265 [Isosphaeraceae bacterium]